MGSLISTTAQNCTTYITITTTPIAYSLFSSAYNLFVSISTCSLFFSHDYSLFCLQLFCKQYSYSLDLHSSDLQTLTCTQDWYNNFWLPFALACSFIVQQDQSNESSWNGIFLFCPSTERCRNHNGIFAFLDMSFTNAYCCWFRCSMYLLMCFCVHIAVCSYWCYC